MPIKCAISIDNLTRDEFIRRDELVMDCAYAAQNKLGRLCDERVYENELADRLRTAGVKDVATQVPLYVTHGPFTKEYRLDLVADHAVYELKTVTQFTRAHDAQLFNYAMCLGIRCIKLINFRGNNVDGKLRIMSVTAPERHAAKISTNDWQPLSPRCQLLKQHLTGLVDDLGGFLEASLYEEALSCILAAPETRLTVTSNGIELGTHATRMLADHIAFYVSGLTENIPRHRPHLQRLLATLPLKAIHWINFNRQEITLTTLIK
ncbi:GxxExxY protein [Prosthecobacter sp.]|uniref:GxxExxY protein n=1 Tax=Prosthecobacter sp. TaxID=1965333 RepID=UPI003784088A